MSIYLTGDTHGHADGRFRYDWPWYLDPLRPDDVVIILGDFGLLWEPDEGNWEEELSLDSLGSFGSTFLFIDGNHENHDRLKKLETVRLFGAPAGKVSEHVFHLRRGEIYEIEGKTFFCMGGATSIDRRHRHEGTSWWPEENVSREELQHGLNNLKRHGNTVDYILTHTPPRHIGLEMFPRERDDPHYADPTAEKLDTVLRRTEFKQWFFGHMHFNCVIQSDPRFVSLFDRVIRLGDPKNEDENMLPKRGEICPTRAQRRSVRM